MLDTLLTVAVTLLFGSVIATLFACFNNKSVYFAVSSIVLFLTVLTFLIYGEMKYLSTDVPPEIEIVATFGTVGFIASLIVFAIAKTKE